MITAKFIGTDGSCGFRTNSVYVLVSMITQYKLHICDTGRPEYWIPYSSLDKFLENWEIVSYSRK